VRAGELFYRDLAGGEPPVVVLHGGWGYDFYPYDDAIAGIRRRFVIPDRSGYGQSLPKRTELPPDFHAMYARETEGLLETLSIARSSSAGPRSGAEGDAEVEDRSVLWGHSDGAIIAVHMALAHPERYAGIVLEAMHLDREKPASREFFEMMARGPEAFGERVAAKLEPHIVMAGGRAWLDIAKTPGTLVDVTKLRVPTLVLHGSDDPRTEPGELDAFRGMPNVEIRMIEGAGHSPHCERASASICTSIVARFLGVLAMQ
jgi:pimeloyl-ACP methyl ester carboxylesterase